MLLSVCLITRDKASFIPRTINSVKGIADEIILIDLGSKDKTQIIAEEMGVTVYQYKKNCKSSGSLNYARVKAQGKWVLFLEANEELLDDYQQLRTLLRNTKNDGFYLPTIEFDFFKKRKYFMGKDEDKLNLPKLSLRLYRNKNSYKYNKGNYSDITNTILKVDGEASLKVLHLPILRRNIFSMIPEEIRPSSLFYFDIENHDILKKDALFKYIKDGIKEFWNGENNLAIRKFEEAYFFANEKNKSNILENLVLLLLEDKQYQRAEVTVQTALEKYPANVVFLFWQGYIEYIKGNFQIAIKCFKNILNGYAKKKGDKIKHNSYFLLGLSFLATNNKEEAELNLKKVFLNDKDNRLLINSLLEIKELDINILCANFQLDDPVNRKLFFILLECLFFRREYQLLEDIIERQKIIKKEDNHLLYWQGLINLKKEKYNFSLKQFKKIRADFIYFKDVLHFQWILNLLMSGRLESKSIVNQIKLLGDKINWNIIKYFNEIYFYGQDVSFKFDNLLAKIKFYNRALYFLDRLIEYGSSKSIIIMLEIIDSLNITRASNDIGILFYIHGYWEEAYEYLKLSMKQGESIPELNIMGEVCKRLGKNAEEKKWNEKSEYLDPYKEINIHGRKFAPFVEY